ncbi:MAG: DUF2807 domain-containing protein, partial [Bacteroidia bacterium]|nr:DUF2807 domain-containing protein [Bacteroidia bacterium]
SGDASCTINGFSDTTARSFSISGSGGCSYYGNASYLDAQISGAGYLTVSGNILLADVDVSGESRFEGKNMLANSTTTILASGDARGYVNTIDTLTADASGQARIYYKGDPTVKNFTTSGQGKILPF